ncbi:CD276 antigen-like isoform X2 [Pelmatolapia mariae]|uniref:CD276 antigen-like isoform X2 n=1 Tax=Pelmatolapia mariae TaxID=158779 RepID=UPI002FE5C983
MQQEEKMICRILLLIILTSCVSGSFVVNVTQTCYQAEENHNITLEWTFTTKPDRSTKSLSIICCLIARHEHFVLYRVIHGVEWSKSQDKKFSGRVQSYKDALREGRIRLQLSRLRTDDSGLYLCEVNTDYRFSSARCRVSVSGPESRNKNYWDQVKIVLGVLESALLTVGGMIVLIIIAVQGLV